MRSDEEYYFSDAEPVALCSNCGVELYNFDTIYNDCTCDECLCEDCLEEHLGVKRNDDDLFEPCRCIQCNSILTDEFESVVVDDLRFCDLMCVKLFHDIKEDII